MCSWKSRIPTQSDHMPLANAERSMPNAQCPMQSCPLARAPARFTGCHPQRREGSHMDSRRRFGIACMINRLTRGLSSSVRLGMIEPLACVPVRDWQVVLSKFFGALVFYVILWIPTLLYFAIFLKVTNEPAAHSAGAYAGSYLMLLLLGMFYLSIGCLTSVLTRNQIIAAVISFCAITLLFFLGLVQFILLDVSSETRDLLGYFSAIEHMGTFSRGVIDTRPIILYVSMTIVMLVLTHQAFQSRKWRL